MYDFSQQADDYEKFEKAINFIEANFKSRAGLKYISCDGLDLLDAQRGAMAAEKYPGGAKGLVL